MINFTRAFETAWERTGIILFNPFDPGKWLIIGFNAFLVFLSEGSFSFNQAFHTENQTNYESLPALLHGAKQIGPWLNSYLSSSWLMLYLGLVFIGLCVWLVLNWVGCRGQFHFIDNIVRNRAAVSWPWRRYAREGNAWFLFHLVFIVFSWILFIALAGVFIGLNWSWINHEREPSGSEVVVLLVTLLFGMGIWLIYAGIDFLLRSFVVPLLFKQTFDLWGALAAVGRLVVAYPGSIIVYLLISFALAIAASILSVLVFCLACCFVCWIMVIPFVGSILLLLVLSMLLLPVLVFWRCFQLECLAQFGPEYDVWIVDVPAAGSTPVAGFTPQPPLG